jgi:hypothetical protein
MQAIQSLTDMNVVPVRTKRVSATNLEIRRILRASAPVTQGVKPSAVDSWQLIARTHVANLPLLIIFEKSRANS